MPCFFFKESFSVFLRAFKKHSKIFWASQLVLSGKSELRTKTCGVEVCQTRKHGNLRGFRSPMPPKASRNSRPYDQGLLTTIFPQLGRLLQPFCLGGWHWGCSLRLRWQENISWGLASHWLPQQRCNGTSPEFNIALEKWWFVHVFFGCLCLKLEIRHQSWESPE